MVSGTPPNGGGGKTGPKPGWKEAFPKVWVPWGQDAGGEEQRDSLSPGLVGQGQEEGPCSSPGDGEEPLDRPDPEVPGATGREICRTSQGTLLRLALGVALILALVVAVVVLAERQGGSPAPVLACPEDWVGYRGVCYYFSKPYTEEGSWDWSLEQCSSRGASLAVLQRDWELDFLSHLRGRYDYWLGLQRRDGRLVWGDGSSFNQTVQVLGQDECVFLNAGDFMSVPCQQKKLYICSKPQILPK